MKSLSSLHMALLIWLVAPMFAAGQSSEWANSLGQELLGSHFEYVRGFTFPMRDRSAATMLAASSPSPPPEPVDHMDIPCANFSVFGYKFACIVPCGDVTVGPDGQNFTTTFGVYHVAGAKKVDKDLTMIDNAFSHYTGVAVGWFLLGYFLWTLVHPDRFKATMHELGKMCGGILPSDEKDGALSEAENVALVKSKLDPESDSFICPGNIYRLVSVMHPGEVGYKQWLKYCFKAGLCAYMQFYLPYNILTSTTKLWKFNGIKSPLYFGLNSISFFTQFAALGNVCTLFASKCAEVIEGDCQAVFFLVTHSEPEEELLKDEVRAMRKDKSMATENRQFTNIGNRFLDLENKLSAKLGMGSDKVAPAEEPLLGKPLTLEERAARVPSWVLEWNEYFWCALNILLTCYSAIMLMLCMFVKVATFTGDIMNITVVAVSLYFVFDLDDKVMQSDPKLKPRYRKIVVKSTIETEHKPMWIKKVASITIGFVNMCVPLGLMMIVLVSWRQVDDNTVIGGDPFHQ